MTTPASHRFRRDELGGPLSGALALTRLATGMGHDDQGTDPR